MLMSSAVAGYPQTCPKTL